MFIRVISKKKAINNPNVIIGRYSTVVKYKESEFRRWTSFYDDIIYGYFDDDGVFVHKHYEFPPAVIEEAITWWNSWGGLWMHIKFHWKVITYITIMSIFSLIMIYGLINLILGN